MPDPLIAPADDVAEAAARAGVTAAILALGATLERFSLALLVTSVGIALWPPLAVSLPLLLASFVPFGVQAWYALRAGFDREIFAIWAARWQAGGASGSPRDDMVTFDRVLARARPQPEGDAPMPLARRIAGARSLLKRQLLALGAQLLLVAAALLAPGWSVA